MKLNQHKDMEQIKKYIRGNSERGQDVIAELEKLGGKNIIKLKGDEYDKVYYIERYKYTETNTIDFESEKSFIGQLIVTHPDWEEIKLPEQFKDGDVLTNERGSIFIYKGPMYYNKSLSDFYCGYRIPDGAFVPKLSKDKHFGEVSECRLATEEEKQKLFKAIKDNGYKWNAEKKELEKLIEPKFKVGDVIQDEDGYKVKITEVNVEDECYEYESMIAKGIGGIAFSEQDDWKLVPNKFDITTLIPFKSEVLVRGSYDNIWKPAIYGFSRDNHITCVVGGSHWAQCIPYNSNKHLLGTTNDCDEYYKTWEE